MTERVSTEGVVGGRKIEPSSECSRCGAEELERNDAPHASHSAKDNLKSRSCHVTDRSCIAHTCFVEMRFAVGEYYIMAQHKSSPHTDQGRLL